MRAIVVGAAALTIAGCAAPQPSDDRQVGIFAVPSGAICEVSHEGVVIARDIEVPEIVSIDRGLPEIDVTCVREGYAETRVLALIDQEPAIVGNILPGGDGGMGVEGASGTTSGNHFSMVYVELVPELRSFQGAFDGQPSTPFD